PAVCTASPARTEAALSGIAEAARLTVSGARILGIHLEGPFINPKKAGAQEPAEIRMPSVDLMRGFIRTSRGLIRIVTCAPELEGGAAFGKFLRSMGIVPAIGHSDADYAEGIAAIGRGVLYATHLGNAMNGLHHREPGAALAYLDDPRPYVEIIPDGVHLHPSFVRLAVRLKGDKAVAITDALEGLPPGVGSHAFGGRLMKALRDRYAFADGTIAGSRLTMDRALKNLIEFTGEDVVSCVKLLTVNPASAIGLSASKGLIRKGYDADIAVLDRDRNVEMTVVEGKIVYCKREA
ncbi:MAG TPA: N-acetylglucosamine-6-phosphate deacetylase, partial [bacterium]|nr:N-acetylglucosamine-6-phosphate deacetylase [bacterium]